MKHPTLENVTEELARTQTVRPVGRVAAVRGMTFRVDGLAGRTALGHILRLDHASKCLAEVIEIDGATVTALSGNEVDGLKVGVAVHDIGPGRLAPDASWMGRIIDPLGRPLDGRPILGGPNNRALRSDPPPAVTRRGLGPRVQTGLHLFNTLLPIARGQRLGLFAGPGVGKSTLLGRLAQDLEADVVVVALCGERGREVSEFVSRVLGPAGLARSVVVAATSDSPAMLRHMCGLSAMTVAEHFRDLGLHVLLLFDSVTRFADAHREIAISSGESIGPGGYPSSLGSLISSLCERAGPGTNGQGDITALFSVLVAGGDFSNPVSDSLRGVLDGHVVLSRDFAERGRFPAVDVLRSVSRSLPHAATESENGLIGETRRILATYEEIEPMLRAGLFEPGHDVDADHAVAVWTKLDTFFSQSAVGGTQDSFAELENVIRRRNLVDEH